MNYKKIYDSIVEKRCIEEPQDVYTEVHHIVPRSLGGSNEANNLVKLTAREHFLCHYLLAKTYIKDTPEWYKMNHAFMMMKCQSITNDRYYNSRLYEALRGNFSSIMSFVQSGNKNCNYGKIWISNVENKKSIMIKKDEVIPDGWSKGRNKWNDVESRNARESHLRKKEDDRVKNAKFWFDLFIKSGCKTVEEFVNISTYDKSALNLIHSFKKYLNVSSIKRGKIYYN